MKEISELLLKDDIRASHRGILKFLSRYKQRGTIVRKKGSGCTAKINEVIKARIEARKKHGVLYGPFNLYNVPFIYR